MQDSDRRQGKQIDELRQQLAQLAGNSATALQGQLTRIQTLEATLARAEEKIENLEARVK